MELKGVEYLKRKLALKQTRVRTRYTYYEMKNIAPDLSKLTGEYAWIAETLGWCSKAVDSLADRLVFGKFTDDKYQMGSIFGRNNGSILFDSAILGALISSCTFNYISAGDDGYPRIVVIDGYNATGVINPMTGMLYEGYAVLERDDYDKPTLEAYFVPGETFFWGDGIKAYSVKHTSKYPALVPNLFRPDAIRQFGRSRISRACMKLTDGALRTLRRSEIGAEFYSVPQKYVLGLSQDAEFNSRMMTMSTFLAFDKDEDGDRPAVGQFTQQSMAPFVEQMRMFAALFAAETGLTLDDLGFPSDNPSSAEAIKASHENLRLTARKAQRTFETGFKNTGIVAASIRDKFAYDTNDAWFTHISWEPLFEPDSSSIGAMADGMLKLQQAAPDFITADKIHEITGL